jgi:hypothetical protein
MRIIFSRTGFDSQYGQVASPICPDGSMYSLPIPVAGDPHRLGDLRPFGCDLAAIAGDLTKGRLDASTAIHLDPDLEETAIARPAGWRPAFGQIAAAQTHLDNNAVGVGDLFLFFGWFRQVEQAGGAWRYRRSAPNVHALFGWLQVGEKVMVGRKAGPAIEKFPWLVRHPHIVGAASYGSTNNCIYIGSRSLVIDGKDLNLPGASTFARFRTDLQLTAPSRSRSWWQLPNCFYPETGRVPLSYHANPSRWTRGSETTLLRVVDKGQEFVLDTAQYPEATAWAANLFKASA